MSDLALQSGHGARAAEWLSTLSDLSRDLARPLTLEDLFRCVYAAVSRVLDGTIFVFGLYEEESQMVHVVRQMISGQERPGGSFPLGSGVTSTVIRTRQPRLLRRWSDEGPPIRVRYAADGGASPESALTVPLLWGQHVIGMLSVQAYQPGTYDEADLAVLEAIASQTALALQNLRHSEESASRVHHRVMELEAIIASMADALVIVDGAGSMVRLNRAARELLRADQNGLVLGEPLDGQAWERWSPGARAIAELLKPMVDAVREGRALQEVEAELRDGGRRVLSFSCAPLWAKDGTAAGGVIVFRDVTERRAVERLKDEVLSIASHDLKTPITAIRARAELMRRRGRVTDIAEGVAAIVRQSDRLTRMLDLLLDLSRVETGRFELSLAPADLVPVVSTVLESVRSTSEAHRFELTAPPSVVGYWDERRLEQLVQNLLTNAVKYSPGGGTIEVTIREVEQDVRVSIRDEGIGMPPEELDHVFDRFYRIEGSRRRVEGEGLGLYICRAIVVAHGGRIWVESGGVGHGTTVHFAIPRRTEDAPAAV